MQSWHIAPPPFNLDAVVDHETLSRLVSDEMERLEEKRPCKSREERKHRYSEVYKKHRANFHTYGELKK